MSGTNNNVRHPDKGTFNPNHRAFGRSHSTVRKVQHTVNRFDRFVCKAIKSSISHPVLLHAPAAIGKTTTVIRNAPHFHPTTYFAPRDDLKKQALSIATKAGHSAEILPSAPKHCPAFDDSTSQYNEEAVELWEHGVKPSHLHKHLDLHPNQECKYNRRNNQIRNALDSIDLLIGDPLHAYLPTSVDNRLVVFDEMPVQRFESTYAKAHRHVSRWLSQGSLTSLLPDSLTSWDDAIQIRGTQEGEKARNALRGIWAIDSEEIRRGNSVFHRDAALALRAVLGEENLGDGYKFSKLARNRLMFNKNNPEVTVFRPPNLGEARGILGLDATPRPSLWNLLLNHREFELWKTFECSSREWKTYHRDILGVEIKQLGKALKPYDGSNHTLKRDEAVFRFIREQEGIKPDLITTKAAIEKYRRNGLLDFVDESCNFRSVKSSNIFRGDNHTVGVIQGCPHPGDGVLKKWCALLKKPTSINGKGSSKTYGGKVQNAVAHHFMHDLVYHAVMRFSRGDAPATVYLNTTAADEWLSPDRTLFTDFDNNWRTYVGVKPNIRVYLQQHGNSTITGLAEAVGYSKNRVREGINELDSDEDSPVERQDRPGPKPDKVVCDD